MPKDTNPDLKVRVVTMTIYEISAALAETTQFGQKPTHMIGGYVRVKAVGGSDRHEWYLGQNERPWIGDTVDVTIVEPAEGESRSARHYPAPMNR